MKRRPSQNRKQAAVRRLCVVGLMLLLGFTLLTLRWPDLSIAAPGLAVATGGLLAALLIFNIRKLGVPMFFPSTVLLAAFGLFHLGAVLPSVFDLVTSPAWLDALEERELARALTCVLLALTCFELGLLSMHKRPLAPVAPWPVHWNRRSTTALFSGGLLAGGVGVAAAAANLATLGVGTFLSGAYGYEFYATTDSRLLAMCVFWLLPTAVVIVLAGARRGTETAVAAWMAGLTLALLLFLGDRGGALSMAAAGLLVWSALRGSPPPRVVASVCIGALLVIPVVSEVRRIPRSQLGLRALVEAAPNASPLAAVAEMGASLRPLAETVRLVPSEAPYRQGQSYGAAAERVLPNVGFTKATVDWSDPTSLPPGHWITYTVAPWTYAAFGGIGFSGVAEPYLNFGVPGVLGYFLTLGLLVGWCERRLADRPRRMTVAIVAVAFMPLLLSVRNDFHNVVRPALWGILLVYAIERLHGVRPSRVVTAATASSPR